MFLTLFCLDYIVNSGLFVSIFVFLMSIWPKNQLGKRFDIHLLKQIIIIQYTI
mgnify:FL=1